MWFYCVSRILLARLWWDELENGRPFGLAIALFTKQKETAMLLPDPASQRNGDADGSDFFPGPSLFKRGGSIGDDLSNHDFDSLRTWVLFLRNRLFCSSIISTVFRGCVSAFSEGKD